MKRICPESECPSQNKGPNSVRIVRKGSYWRRSDGQRIPRWLCRDCSRSFSSSCFFPTYRQKKRKLNHPIMQLLNSGVSQRRAALIVGATRKTIVRKFRFQAEQARISQRLYLKEFEQEGRQVVSVQFDDLETSEHSKCKPLSVALAVEPVSRKILGFQVSQMPARGPLAEIARKKYGRRPDFRSQGWDRFFASLKPIVHEEATWLSDENPHYPRHLKRHHPKAKHETTPGIRGSGGGQGELKRIGFDPLFSLNHTCAMLRANLNRLFRRTWCTTKTQAGLIDHLSLYVRFHNEVLTPPIPCTL